MRRRVEILPAFAALAVALASATLGATAARAEPGPISLVSSNGIEQAAVAGAPALSADGRYVAFVGRIGGLAGLFRKDLTTGEVVPVSARPEAEGESRAEGPAISADGRYVSFTTTEPLDPADDPMPATSDVYVADMAASPPAYTLVSARDGSGEGLSYEGGGGSIASPRVAISADGDLVAFVTTGASDLVGAPGAHEAPAFQVAVRDLATRRTILISATRDPLTGAMQQSVPVAGGAAYGGVRIAPGAAISADGSTVAWIGIHPSLQAEVGASEAAEVTADETYSGGYDEPLWRRVPTPADPAPPTRRAVSAAQFPELVSGRNVESLNCADSKGWDFDPTSLAETTPGLSANGLQMAVIGEPTSYVDAWLFDMSAAQPTVRRLTRAVAAPRREEICSANLEALQAGSGSIGALAISNGGDRVALSTSRQRFPLAPPTLIGAAPVRVGLPELYLIDLAQGSIQRLTHGETESEPSALGTAVETVKFEKGATSISFDAEGETLAFASHASNLVPGDGNGTTEEPAGDVFLVSDPRDSRVPGSSAITRPPAPLSPTPRRVLIARAASRPDGSVHVVVSVPGAGRLEAVAATVAHKGARSRRVATTRRRPFLASTLSFDLTASRSFSAEVHSRGGVEAKLRLGFRGPGGGPLALLLHVRFGAHAKGGKAGRR